MALFVLDAVESDLGYRPRESSRITDHLHTIDEQELLVETINAQFDIGLDVCQIDDDPVSGESIESFEDMIDHIAARIGCANEEVSNHRSAVRPATRNPKQETRNRTGGRA